MQDKTHRVTIEQHRAWHAQFGDEALEAGRLEMTDSEMSEIAGTAAALQVEEDPHAESVSSGIVLPLIAERGLSGAFEKLVEEAAEKAFASAVAAIRTVAP